MVDHRIFESVVSQVHRTGDHRLPSPLSARYCAWIRRKTHIITDRIMIPHLTQTRLYSQSRRRIRILIRIYRYVIQISPVIRLLVAVPVIHRQRESVARYVDGTRDAVHKGRPARYIPYAACHHFRRPGKIHVVRYLIAVIRPEYILRFNRQTCRRVLVFLRIDRNPHHPGIIFLVSVMIIQRQLKRIS